MKRNKYLVGLIILGIVFLDQALKIYVKLNFSYGEDHYLFGSNHFLLLFVENEGMAFGWSIGGWLGKLLLTLMRLAIIVVVAAYLRAFMSAPKRRFGAIIGFTLILAGAIGNIIDSVFYGVLFSASPTYPPGQVAQFLPEAGGYAPLLFGKVVDMFYFPLFQGTYPDWIPGIGGQDFLFLSAVFNIADVAITSGTIITLIWLITHSLRSFIKGKNQLS